MCNYGCRNQVSSHELPIKYNEKNLDSLFQKYGPKLAILSCLRCQCFVEAYNRDTALQKMEGYVLMTDTTCNKMSTPVKNIRKREIDSISEDIYNLTFIKTEKGNVTFKILKVEDSKRIKSIAESFFK